jgi:hypothetical protein
VPEVCRFYGIVIVPYHDDHVPWHFHARYGNDHVAVTIRNLSLLDGWLPSRAFGFAGE